jgi:hypothetical protein
VCSGYVGDDIDNSHEFTVKQSEKIKINTKIKDQEKLRVSLILYDYNNLNE